MLYLTCLTKLKLNWYHNLGALLLLQIGNLQHRLAKVLPAQHAEEAIDGVIDALCDAQLGLEAALAEPLLQLLLVVLCVPGAHVVVADDEAAHGDALRDDLHEVAQRVLLAGLAVVL
jgi:hypothetical protein